jgi:hypothetical protein
MIPFATFVLAIVFWPITLLYGFIFYALPFLFGCLIMILQDAIKHPMSYLLFGLLICLLFNLPKLIVFLCRKERKDSESLKEKDGEGRGEID